MIRVNKQHPCEICQKSDWCLYSEDGQAAICQRIEEGSTKRCGNAGWLHILKEGSKPHRKPFKRYRPEAVRDFAPESNRYKAAITGEQIEMLSKSLGVSSQSLKRLNVGYDGEAYTFPMRDENLRVIGIRRRFDDGRKFAVKGSCNGLFIPNRLDNGKPLVICEGPTDTAAGLDLGFDGIGRPNCDSRVEMTVKFARARKITIIADNDAVGVEGAKKLAVELVKHCPSVKIICPPLGIKDLREWKQKGFNGEQIRHGY